MALALADCAQNPVAGNPNLVLLTESQEIAMGRREGTNFRRQYDVYDDAQLLQYVNEIGQQLAKSSHRPGLEYHCLVVDAPEVNAFAHPFRLHIITAQAGLTFAELARRSAGSPKGTCE